MRTTDKQPVRFVILVFLAAAAAACGGSEGPPGGAASSSEDVSTETTADGLTAEELEYGIGPIRSLDLEPVDRELAERGAEIFRVKCAACHKIDEDYVGPALRGLTERRTPEFVMNMILNPDEMVARHPEVKALLAQYYTPMPDQNLSEEDARAVLEYLRDPSVAPHAADVDEGGGS
ncbi:MAG: c-type cytochrome [Gemmatimonadota bacterium]